MTWSDGAPVWPHAFSLFSSKGRPIWILKAHSMFVYRYFMDVYFVYCTINLPNLCAASHKVIWWIVYVACASSSQPGRAVNDCKVYVVASSNLCKLPVRFCMVSRCFFLFLFFPSIFLLFHLIFILCVWTSIRWICLFTVCLLGSVQ